MLTDALIDRHGQNIPVDKLCQIFNEISIPTARKRIFELVHDHGSLNFEQDEILIELELCISVTFKPFIHHLRILMTQPKELTAIWMSILSIVSQLLGEETHGSVTTEIQSMETRILSVTKQLASEHLRNAIMVLASNGVIEGKGSNNVDDSDHCTKIDDIEALTWNALDKIVYCKKLIPAWKLSVLE